MLFSNVSKNTCKELPWFLLKCVLFFFLVYPISPIPAFQALTTERLAVAILCLLVLIRRKFSFGKDPLLKKTQLAFACFQVFLLFYSVLLLLIGGSFEGTTLTASILNFILFAIPINLIDSVDELMRILFVITFIQCLIIVLGMVNGGFANFLDTVVNYNSYFDFAFMRKGGYPGGWGCITSTGAMQLSLGLIACAYFILHRRLPIFYWCSFFFFGIVGTAVARTALLLFAVTFLFLVFDFCRTKKLRHILLFFATVAVVLAAIVVVIQLSGIGDVFFRRLQYLFELGLYEGFFKSYFADPTTVIPPLSVHTLFGTGIVSGVSGFGVAVNADGGFVRMYTAIGLPLAIVFYGFIYGMMIRFNLKISNKRTRIVAWLFLAFMLLGELKEFYFYSRYMFVFYNVFIATCLRASESAAEKMPESTTPTEAL